MSSQRFSVIFKKGRKQIELLPCLSRCFVDLLSYLVQNNLK